MIVDLDQRDDRVQGRNIATQHLQTQVRGDIGAWIPIGGINSSQTEHSRALTGEDNSSDSSTADIAIKVELLNR